ncbi:hypothetical protein K1719_020598 [Acacia pycnantha]|nr:hypothetical protein K1719_020598 [Acacia pycnantha]
MPQQLELGLPLQQLPGDFGSGGGGFEVGGRKRKKHWHRRMAPDTAEYYVIWIEYNGSSKKINIFIREQPDITGPIVSKPEKSVLTSNLELKTIVKQSSYLGFYASTGIIYQLNCVLKWNMTVKILSENKKKAVIFEDGFGYSVGTDEFDFCGDCRRCLEGQGFGEADDEVIVGP